MREIEISVVSSYLDWSMSDGIRELIQNAIDADAKSFLSSIDYDRTNRRLSIKNEGAHLPVESLLIGYTTKKNDPEMIGQFGEGMKFGCMVLLKWGLEIRIHNGNELWIPKLGPSKNFPGQEVLIFTIDDQAIQGNDLEIAVIGLNDFDWQKIKPNFLMFLQKNRYVSFETPYGSILESKEDDFAGRVYINGLLVETIADETFRFGYDLNPGWVQVDRDRKMTNRYSLKNVTAKMWTYLSEQPEHFKTLEKMLKEDAVDLAEYAYDYGIPSELKDKLYRNFIKEFGKNAYPVFNNEEGAEVTNIGKKAVMFGRNYVRILRTRLGEVSFLKSDYQRSVKTIFPLIKLASIERDTINKARRILGEVIEVPSVKICEFHASETESVYMPENQTIYISRRVLGNFQETLKLLVREYCRKWGSSGSLYESELETVWSGLYQRLTSGVIDDSVSDRQSGEDGC